MAASLIQCAQVKQRKSLLASPCPVEYSPTERNEAHRSLKQPLQLTVSNFKKGRQVRTQRRRPSTVPLRWKRSFKRLAVTSMARVFNPNRQGKQKLVSKWSWKRLQDHDAYYNKCIGENKPLEKWLTCWSVNGVWNGMRLTVGSQSDWTMDWNDKESAHT